MKIEWIKYLVILVLFASCKNDNVKPIQQSVGIENKQEDKVVSTNDTGNSKEINDNKKTNLDPMELMTQIGDFVSFKSWLNNSPKTQKYRVISTNGVNVRKDHNAQSEKLFSLPYGTLVEIVETPMVKKDTIGSHNIFIKSKGEIVPLSGYWVKIEYGNQSGYVFDPFIYRDWNNKFYKPQKGMNDDYVLLFPGSWCHVNFHYKESLNWYGVYVNESTSYIVPIDLSYYRDYNGEMTDIGISANKNKDLKFIIGSNQKWVEGKLDGEYHENWWSHNYKNIIELSREEDEKYGASLIVQKGEIQQTLNPIYEGYRINPSGVIWKGDLDGDGKEDYIIHFGTKQGETLLYLSSKADEEQIVKPVANFKSGYCC